MGECAHLDEKCSGKRIIEPLLLMYIIFSPNGKSRAVLMNDLKVGGGCQMETCHVSKWQKIMSRGGKLSRSCVKSVSKWKNVSELHIVSPGGKACLEVAIPAKNIIINWL